MMNFIIERQGTPLQRFCADGESGRFFIPFSRAAWLNNVLWLQAGYAGVACFQDETAHKLEQALIEAGVEVLV